MASSTNPLYGQAMPREREQRSKRHQARLARKVEESRVIMPREILNIKLEVGQWVLDWGRQNPKHIPPGVVSVLREHLEQCGKESFELQGQGLRLENYGTFKDKNGQSYCTVIAETLVEFVPANTGRRFRPFSFPLYFADFEALEFKEDIPEPERKDPFASAKGEDPEPELKEPFVRKRSRSRRISVFPF